MVPSWLDFDPDVVRRDLHAVASLGADHVRVFPLRPVIQPARGLIRPRALSDVVRVVDIAAEFGLDVNVDALQGHLSSFDFMPSWLESRHRRNMFTDPEVVAAEADYVHALAHAVADRPNLIGITLGNEVNQFAAPRRPLPHVVTPGGAGAWLATLVEAARAGLGASSALVTNAMFDTAWYDDRQPFGPEHAVRHGDATVVHSWVFNGAAQAYGVQNLWGITWWCSHDVPLSLPDFPELEYDLGLITTDGRIKPAGRRFATLARELRHAPTVAPTPDAVVLDENGERASRAPGGAFFERWLQLAEALGRGPQIVLRSQLTDRALLDARGIRSVHESAQPAPA